MLAASAVQPQGLVYGSELISSDEETELLGGPQHSNAASKELRYSITFRTLR